MAKTYKVHLLKRASRYIQYGLALLLFATACHQQKDQDLAIRWEQHTATALIIHRPGTGETAFIRRKGIDADILGSITRDGGNTIFTPLVPFTPGSIYEVYFGKKKWRQIGIPYPFRSPPQILAIYPSADTLPVNLLKYYFHFSRAMQQGRALANIQLLNSKGQTLPGIFLDLQPELWDTTGTILTVWLDPGRIKRGLELNKLEGNPLKEGERYTLRISASWKDVYGIPLKKTWYSAFVAGKRAGKFPGIDSWEFTLPAAGGKSSLIVDTKSGLDHYLAENCIGIYNLANVKIPGRINLSEKRHTFSFTPDVPWLKANYVLKADPKLEDLAGNNLVRPFDRDLREKRDKTVFQKGFSVQ